MQAFVQITNVKTTYIVPLKAFVEIKRENTPSRCVTELEKLFMFYEI